MLRALPFALTLLVAAPALAEPWACNFTVECLAAGDCDSAGWSVELLPADHEGRLFLSTITGDSPVTRLSQPGTLPASYAAAGASGLAELLTVEPDGTAIITVHLFDAEDGGAQAITYFGTCEAL